MGECIMQKAGGGLKITEWSGTSPRYIENNVLEHAPVCHKDVDYLEVKLWTIDCPQDISLNVHLKTRHDYQGNDGWSGSGMCFKVFDRNKHEIMTLDHAKGNIGGKEFESDNTVPFKKGLNYIYFVYHTTYDILGNAYKATGGFHKATLTFGDVFPVFDSDVHFDIKVL